MNTENKNSVSPAERYLEHLNRIFKTEPEFLRNDSLIDGIPGVTTIIYRNALEEGLITGCTYGLSLVAHPAWKFGRAELCITVESEEEAWPDVAGYVANQLRGKCPFSYGETINFGELISEDSDMDNFFVFAPAALEKTEYLNIDIGLDYTITISGLYPIYSDELDVFSKIGLEKFWHHPDFDVYSVHRKHITESA